MKKGDFNKSLLKFWNNSKWIIIPSTIFISVLIIFGLIIFGTLNDKIEIDAPVLMTEYWKFIGTLLTIIFGWVLVNVLWQSREYSKRQQGIKATMIMIIDAIGKKNIETMELINGDGHTMSVGEKSKYIESNIHRQRDMFETLCIVYENLLNNSVVDSHTRQLITSFINDINEEFNKINTEDYKEIRNIKQPLIESLIYIGKSCEKVKTQLLEEQNDAAH